MALDRPPNLTLTASWQGELLGRAAHLLNSTLPLEEKVATLTEQLRTLMGCHQALARLSLPPPFPPTLQAHTLTESLERWREALAQACEPLLQRVCQQQHPLRLTREALEAQPSWQTLELPPSFQGWLGVPLLRNDGQLLGVLQLGGRVEGEFSEADEALLLHLGHLLALAAENARLARAEQHARQVAETLRVANLALTQNLELDAVLETLLDYLGWIVPYDAASVLLCETPTRVRMRANRHFDDLPPLFSKGELLEIPGTPLLERLHTHQRSLSLSDSAQQLLGAEGSGAEQLRSWLGVPLLSKEETIGFCLIEKQEAHFFNEEHLRLVEALAAQTEVAIRNARHFEALRLRASELEVLAEVSAALRVARTVEEMLPIFLQKVSSIVGATQAAIYLTDKSRERLLARGWYPPEPSWLGQPHPSTKLLRVVEGINDNIVIVKEGSPLAAQLLPTDRLAPDARQRTLALPLRTVDEIVGMLYLTLPQVRPLTQIEERLLTALAEMASNSLHRAALHEQTEQRLHRLAALRTIDWAITTNLDLVAPLEVVLGQVRAQLGVDAANILLFDPQHRVLEYVVGQGFQQAGPTGATFPLDEGLTSQSVREHRLVAASQMTHIPIHNARRDWWCAEGFVTYYSVPLLSFGQCKGILEVFHRSRLRPDAEWIDFLETLAGQAAIAIDKAQLFADLQASNQELAQAYDATIAGWARALDLRDEGTRGHSDRVTDLTLRLAERMGIEGEALVHIRRGALLHDIGKMGVPDSILLKPGHLTTEEREVMERHPGYAHEMLAPIPFLRAALDIPYCHHEKWDGTGYPRGLQGEEIPLPARLFAVVDVWDALRSDRPYRKAWSVERVRAHLRELAGSHFDPEVVEVFLAMDP